MPMDPEKMRKVAEQMQKTMEPYAKAQKKMMEAVRVPRYLPPQPIKLPEIKNRNMADTLHGQVQEVIEGAEKKLQEGQELVAWFFDRVGRPIRMTDLGYYNPNMMIVWGVDPEGNDCSVLVHMSSFELVLQVVEVKPEQPRRPVGFIVPAES
jgi:hypothetical protein